MSLTEYKGRILLSSLTLRFLDQRKEITGKEGKGKEGAGNVGNTERGKGKGSSKKGREEMVLV